MKPLDSTRIDLGGTRLIEASAGTGKTYTITTLYLRLVIEEALTVGEIVVVTFTKAATAELRSRIRDRLRDAADVFAAHLAGQGDAVRGRDGIIDALADAALERDALEAAHRRLAEALCGFDEAAIYTIHGFAQRVLQENAFESGVRFDLEFDANMQALFTEVATDFWSERLFDAPDDFVAYVRKKKVGDGSFSAGGPSLLAKLAQQVVGDPRRTILPTAPPPDAQFEDARAAFVEAHALAAAQWRAQREEILGLLVESDDLNRTSYKVSSILGKWAPALDEALARPMALGAEAKNAIEKLKTPALAQGVKKNRVPPTHAFFDACEKLCEAEPAYAAALEARFIGLEVEMCAYAREEVARRKSVRNALSYDDLIHDLADALRGDEGERLAEQVRGLYKAALIDEFQDTDVDQYEIFRRIWHDRAPLFLIGDPKQAIYGFRNADVFAYIDAKGDAGEHAYTLTQNWRSDPGLIASVNALFSNVPHPFLFDAIGFDPVEPAPGAENRMTRDGEPVVPFRVLHLPRPPGAAGKSNEPKEVTKTAAREAIHPAIGDDIARLLSSDTRIGERRVMAGDIAVLCRSKAEVGRVQAALAERGIPSVVHAAASVLESDEARWLERLFAAIAEPTDMRTLRAALTTPLIGLDGVALAALEADTVALDAWLERFREWNASAQRHGPVQLLAKVTARCDARSRLLARPDGERRLTNLLHLSELLQEAAARGGLGPNGLATWLERMRTDASAREPRRSETAAAAAGERCPRGAAGDHPPQQGAAVRHRLLHRSVGWRTRARQGRRLGPLSRPRRRARLEARSRLAGPRRERLAAQVEALAEAIRVAYVALTRAKHQVVCAWGAINGADTSALSLLLHPEAPVPGPIDLGDAAFIPRRVVHFEALTQQQIEADLAALCARAEGRIEVERAVAAGVDAVAIEQSRAGTPDLEARRLDRGLDPNWRTSSFSQLVSAGLATHAPGGERASDADHPRAEGRDYDGDTPGDAPDRGGEELEIAADSAPVRLHAFPAGAGPGTMIHTVFEQIDFEAGDDEATRAIVARALARFGAAAALEPDLRAGVQDTLHTPLGGDAGALTLSQVPRARRLDELEFLLPAAHHGPRIGALDLASRLRDDATHPAVIAYAERVEAMRFQPLAGYLRGYIDLIFAHDERFYVVDYKSNQLGPYAQNYTPERLAVAMTEHDYILQYHLYCVALHRYLAHRLRGYTYERNFGGVYYLFLRGMAPGHPAGCGVFHDRPGEALVRGLSDCFGEGDAAVNAAGAVA